MKLLLAVRLKSGCCWSTPKRLNKKVLPKLSRLSELNGCSARIYTNSVDRGMTGGMFSKGRSLGARKTIPLGNSTNLIIEPRNIRGILASQSDNWSGILRFCNPVTVTVTTRQQLLRGQQEGFLTPFRCPPWAVSGRSSWEEILFAHLVKDRSPADLTNCSSILIWQEERGGTWNDARLQWSHLRACCCSSSLIRHSVALNLYLPQETIDITSCTGVGFVTWLLLQLASLAS